MASFHNSKDCFFVQDNAPIYTARPIKVFSPVPVIPVQIQLNSQTKGMANLIKIHTYELKGTNFWILHNSG